MDLDTPSGATLAPGVPADIARDPQAYMARLDELRMSKLRRQIAYCHANEYYGEKLRQAGVAHPADIRTMDDFRSLPALLTKAQHRESQQMSLEKYGHPFGLHLCADLRDVVHVAGTSGTTGLPTFYLFTRRDLELTYLTLGRMFAMAGIRPGDTVLQLFGLSIWVAGTTVLQALEAYGARPIPLGAEAGVSKALQYIAMCRPRAICGTPSMLRYLIERAPVQLGRDFRSLGVEIIIAAGEPGMAIPAYRKRIQEGTGARVYDMTGGAWLNAAMECGGPDHQGLHYLAEDYCFRYDLVDPETRKPIALVDGAVGEAIHTGLEYEAAPALRYATGDILKLHLDTCPHCGQFGARFSFVGRADDLMNVAGVKVYPAAVKEVIEGFSPRLTGLMQIVLDRPPPHVVPPVPVLAQAGPDCPQAQWPALAREVEQQIHHVLKIRTRVEVVPEGRIEQSNLKTKLVRVQDKA